MDLPEEMMQKLYEVKHRFLAIKKDLSKGLENFANPFQKVFLDRFTPDLFVRMFGILFDRGYDNNKVELKNGVKFKSLQHYFSFFTSVSQVFPYALKGLTESELARLEMDPVPVDLDGFFRKCFALTPENAGSRREFSLENVIVWLCKEVTDQLQKKMAALKPAELKEPESGSFKNVIRDFQAAMRRLKPEEVEEVGECKTLTWFRNKQEFTAR